MSSPQKVKTVFYIMNYGSSVRNMVKGGVLEKLIGNGWKLVLFSVHPKDRTLILDALPHDQVVFEEIGNIKFRGFPRLLQRLRTYVWRNRVDYRELSAIHGSGHSVTNSLQGILGRLLHAVPFSIWRWLGRLGHHWDRGQELLRLYNPSAIIISNPIADEAVAVEYCRRRSVKTICALESWDNLTNRGALYCLPDHLLVWNTLIRDEAFKLHQYPASRVHVNGMAAFDLYATPQLYPDEPTWRRENNLPDNGPVIVYSMSSRSVYEDENVVVRVLCDARSAGKLPHNAHIVIRFHPRDAEFARCQFADMEGVTLQHPDLSFKHTNNDATMGGNPVMLGATMKYASVVINMFSTMCLDAMANDTPVVVVNFDPPGYPVAKSVTRFQRFAHVKKLMEYDAVWVADDPDQLIQGIQTFLKHPDHHLQQRIKCIHDHTGGLLGRSAETTVRTLDQIINGQARP